MIVWVTDFIPRTGFIYFSKMKFNKKSSVSSLTDENLENQINCAIYNMIIDLKKSSKKTKSENLIN